MRYKTYHNQQFLEYSFDPSSLQSATIRPAAILDCASLDEVFEKTNNIGHPWTKNPGIQKVITDRPRSLSVGDLVEEVDSGRAWVCEIAGWREIPSHEFKGLNIK